MSRIIRPHATEAMPIAAIACALALSSGAAHAESNGPLPQRVTFPSADGRTTLDGYVYAPRGQSNTPRPAVVLMHGRGGVYSNAAKGRYDASTISQRHRMWGRFWARQGYVAVLVDSFGPRGYPGGFPRFSYKDRPAELNEVTIRPLDAYGALAYLRSRKDVVGDRVGLHGFSNGGSAALSTMATGAPGIKTHTPAAGFRAALAFYPACRLKGRFDDKGYRPYAPVRVFHGTDDEETSAKRCAALVKRSRALGGDITIHLYPGATHGFDDPGKKRQAIEGNAGAKSDVMARAQRLFTEQLEARP